MKHVSCGNCTDSDSKSTVAECICDNQDKITRDDQANFEVCVGKYSRYGAYIKEIGAGMLLDIYFISSYEDEAGQSANAIFLRSRCSWSRAAGLVRWLLPWQRLEPEPGLY